MKKLIALCALSLFASNSAFAESEEKEEGIIEEVVVTATYRETDLMDTPVSISAVTDKMVRDTGAQDMEGLFTLIPGLNMSSSGGEGKHRYTVRGVTAQSGYVGSSPTLGTVGIYIDDVPVTSNLGPQSQMNGTLFDIERVEVLKGPQHPVEFAHLIGANSMYPFKDGKSATQEENAYMMAAGYNPWA